MWHDYALAYFNCLLSSLLIVPLVVEYDRLFELYDFLKASLNKVMNKFPAKMSELSYPELFRNKSRKFGKRMK